MASDPHIIDVTAANFDAVVLEGSDARPVLVDFWAAWCGPCQMLMPVLAKLAAEYGGRFLLAKVNTDVEQALAGRYGVRSLPTVKLFKNRTVVNEFLGVKPERDIRALLEAALPRPSDAIRAQALIDFEKGDHDRAIANLSAAAQGDPTQEALQADLARLLLRAGRVDESEAIVNSLSATIRNDPGLQALLADIGLRRLVAGSPPPETLEQTVHDHPGDTQAEFALAVHCVLAGRYEEALDLLLGIVERDRQFKDDLARKTALSVFTLLGGKGELVTRYRRRLSAALH